MDQLIYVLAIMGCGDDNLSCQQARVEPVRYASYVACQEALPAALGRNTDLDYPVIAGACQRRNASMVDAQVARPAGR